MSSQTPGGISILEKRIPISDADPSELLCVCVPCWWCEWYSDIAGAVGNDEKPDARSYLSRPSLYVERTFSLPRIRKPTVSTCQVGYQITMIKGRYWVKSQLVTGSLDHGVCTFSELGDYYYHFINKPDLRILCTWICYLRIALTVVFTIWSSWIDILARLGWRGHTQSCNLSTFFLNLFIG